jgi:hypothetical protein
MKSIRFDDSDIFLKIINKSGLVVDLKLVQRGGRGESDLEVFGIGVAGETQQKSGPSCLQ